MSKESTLFLFSKDDVRNNVDRHDDDRTVDRRPHQLQLARRIARAKTDVPVFNQIFVLCLVFSG